jgi:hypothetical protein
MLPEMGLSNAICLDFDFAIRALKRWADRRSDETIQVQDHTPESERKRRMKSVAKYPTLTAVLGLDDETDTIDPDEVKELAASMLTITNEWAGLQL